MIYSRETITAFLLVILSLACACKSAETTPDDRIRLVVNQSARLASGMTVQVDTIADSRCPAVVQCIWAGNVFVSMLLTKETAQKRVRLILGPDPGNWTNPRPDSTGVVLENITYKVILRDVTPYPGIGKSAQPLQAVIQVSRL